MKKSLGLLCTTSTIPTLLLHYFPRASDEHGKECPEHTKIISRRRCPTDELNPPPPSWPGSALHLSGFGAIYRPKGLAKPRESRLFVKEGKKLRPQWRTLFATVGDILRSVRRYGMWVGCCAYRGPPRRKYPATITLECGWSLDYCTPHSIVCIIMHCLLLKWPRDKLFPYALLQILVVKAFNMNRNLIIPMPRSDPSAGH